MLVARKWLGSTLIVTTVIVAMKGVNFDASDRAESGGERDSVSFLRWQDGR